MRWLWPCCRWPCRRRHLPAPAPPATVGPRPAADCEQGGILIEAVVAVMVLALAAAAIYPGVVHMMRTSRTDAHQAEALALLESAGNVLAAQPYAANGQYDLLCGQAAPGDPCLSLPPGFTLQVATAPDPDLPLQQVTLTVTVPGGRTESLVLYKWDRHGR